MDTPKNWSKLCFNILRKIFETLILVFTIWFSLWNKYVNELPCPSRKLVGFSDRIYCLASSGAWLLMVDLTWRERLSFHLLNVLTRKRINLPDRGPPSNLDDLLKGILGCKKSAVLWIDEITEDYFVAWLFKQKHLFSFKKGDKSWRNLSLELGSANSRFLQVAYRNSKLYLFTSDYHIRVLDFSGCSPQEVETRYSNRPFKFVQQSWEYVWKWKIAVQESGEVLVILSLKEMEYERRLMFYIFKMNLESYEWERVDSIGDEMLIFGHGVTERAPVEDCGDGNKSDSIYFVNDDVWSDHPEYARRASNCGVFDIATSRIKWPKKVCFMKYFVDFLSFLYKIISSIEFMSRGNKKVYHYYSACLEISMAVSASFGLAYPKEYMLVYGIPDFQKDHQYLECTAQYSNNSQVKYVGLSKLNILTVESCL